LALATTRGEENKASTRSIRRIKRGGGGESEVSGDLLVETNIRSGFQGAENGLLDEVTRARSNGEALEDNGGRDGLLGFLGLLDGVLVLVLEFFVTFHAVQELRKEKEGRKRRA
jgi:hypothetical protein